MISQTLKINLLYVKTNTLIFNALANHKGYIN